MGCEIQNSACSERGVMLRLLLVKSEEDSHLRTRENNEGLQHGTAILNILLYLGLTLNEVFALILIFILFLVY